MNLLLSLLFIVNQYPPWLLIRINIRLLFENFLLKQLLLSKWLNGFIQSVDPLFLGLFSLRLLKTELFVLGQNLFCVLLNCVLRVCKYILRDSFEEQDPEISEGSVLMDPLFGVPAVALTASDGKNDLFEGQWEGALGLMDDGTFGGYFIK